MKNLLKSTATISAITLLVFAFPAGSIVAADDDADGEHLALTAVRLYNGVDRPVPILITPIANDAAVDPARTTYSIVLMDAFGRVLLDPVAVTPGEIELTQLLPEIWQIRHACFLQLLVNGSPVGSSLVLQPMISRPPLWVDKAVRPTGQTYTRVFGWGMEPPVGWKQNEVDRPRIFEGGNNTQPPPGEGQPATTVDLRQHEDAPELEEPVFSGLRIYVERDVILHTSKGDLRIALAPEEAPNTVWSFRELAAGGYYDNVIFHRVVPLDRDGWPFVIQGGDPSGTGSGGPGYWLPLEPSALEHDFGVISMARADDPDSAGGQFFFCLSREGTVRLDGQYCAFGWAVEGADTILDIATVRLADVSAGRPVDPPVILRAELVPSLPREPGSGRPDRCVIPEDARAGSGNNRNDGDRVDR
ncbi:MAG: peptidylprolyl isomerase [Phycisphaerales bacterium]